MINSIQGNQTAMPIPPPPPQQKLTEAQQETVTTILSQYDSDSLITEDAAAINEAFRDAGITPGAGLREAIESAGFDPGEIRSLDPPPERSGPRPLMHAENSNFNTEALQTLYEILDDYDLTEITEEQEATLVQQLIDACLLCTGNIVDNFA